MFQKLSIILNYLQFYAVPNVHTVHCITWQKLLFAGLIKKYFGLVESPSFFFFSEVVPSTLQMTFLPWPIWLNHGLWTHDGKKLYNMVIYYVVTICFYWCKYHKKSAWFQLENWYAQAWLDLVRSLPSSTQLRNFQLELITNSKYPFLNALS